mmetsp:Transcript_79758/g.237587  ORF Transcript_79758/g.237587 Transcript_79758/m.237587 type:complete len:213 (+) Transcript_79758:126-764(+)
MDERTHLVHQPGSSAACRLSAGHEEAHVLEPLLQPSCRLLAPAPRLQLLPRVVPPHGQLQAQVRQRDDGEPLPAGEAFRGRHDSTNVTAVLVPTRAATFTPGPPPALALGRPPGDLRLSTFGLPLGLRGSLRLPCGLGCGEDGPVPQPLQELPHELLIVAALVYQLLPAVGLAQLQAQPKPRVLHQLVTWRVFHHLTSPGDGAGTPGANDSS